MKSVKAIDALLPQTQCTECGYAGCLPYAEAIAQDKAPIDRCPPGGVKTVKALAELLGIDAEPYLPVAQANTRPPALAHIREAECIGCTKCIQACPVDAIVGSGKLMHAVITTECTGCGLCVEPCPVDCIELVPIPEFHYDKDLARQRFNARQARLLREEQEKQHAYREKRQLALKTTDEMLDAKAKQDYILQALARVQAKKTNNHE
ncbi:RnfABCDGE type electron transport complex subunit B [Legionella maceachernii]|uniref:Electron transport complex protein n=1 Tax=Legionella maceachernii TaxID=466 RepID=A0A0W0W190_9GAMM|nr:RnfABCDGE type electron transport complex subunit B [Legionella maceachernii]KTD26263.1 electron transport complex protein [Legionella maceachernii]SKA09757.1 electron transport complex protein RnfB [Legionella maceachernii]SUO99450.1 Nitrogen fixation protein rnfB [Legionella maceachernii]